jgi:SNF2 family DNA or RNA helicase
MRRTKAIVIPDLPEKIIQDYPCQMTEQQRILYHELEIN